MGFSKLLTENTIFDNLREILQDFIISNEKRIANIANEVEVGTQRVSTTALRKIKDVLNDPSLFDTLSNDLKIIMAKIAAQSPEYVDDAYKSIFKKMTRDLGLSETDIYRKILESRNSGEPLSKILMDMSGDSDVFIPNLLSQKIYKKLRDFEKNAFEEEIPKPPANVSDNLASKLKNVKVKKNDASEDLSWLRKRFATNRTLFNTVRKNINRSWVYFEEQALGEENFIQSIYNDLVRTGKKITGDLTQSNAELIERELRNTAQKIHRILVKNEENQTALDTLYEQIEKTLLTVDDSEIRSKVPEIMEKLKESDPFRKGSILEKSYWWKFLNMTASQQTINAIARLITLKSYRNKTVGDDLIELVDRLGGWIASASPKRLGLVTGKGEFSPYWFRTNRAKGVLTLLWHLWVAEHVGIPATLALYDVVQNLVLLRFTEHEGTVYDDFKTAMAAAFGEEFVSEYENNNGEVTFKSFIMGLSLHKPGFFKILDYFDTTEQGLNRLKLPPYIEQLLKDEGYSAEEIQEVLRTAKSADEAVEMLKNRHKNNGSGTSPDNSGGNVAPGGETEDDGNVIPDGGTNPINNDTLNGGIPQ